MKITTDNNMIIDRYMDLFKSSLVESIRLFGITITNIENESLSITDVMDNADVHWCLRNRSKFHQSLDDIISKHIPKNMSESDREDLFDVRLKRPIKQVISDVRDRLVVYFESAK